ncbi:MAG: multiheme c-type cytochrome [Myxococcota bacterium]
MAAGLACPAAVLAAPTQPEELVNPLSPPVTCELCHGYENAVKDFGEPDYSPFRTWQGTLMANSARDPVFWAGVAVAAEDAPGETELCIRCHSPRAFLNGNAPAVTSFDQLEPEEREGVECELCHRAMEDPVVPPGNAAYTIDDTIVGVNVPRRGPWDYSDGIPEPPHSWIADPYIGSSRLCGTCHDVTTNTERVDAAGIGMGMNFNEQRTYSEWANSAYAVPGVDFQGCQSCHMPAVPDMAGCTAHLNQHTHPTGGRRHDLVGANRFMVGLLRDEYGSAGANLIADFYFDNAIAAMDEFLPTAASVDFVAPTNIDLEEGLEETFVTITNNTGHKLPSGYSEGRVMWLEFTASYGGEVIYSSGEWNQVSGEIHEDSQLRTYEAIGMRWSDGTTLHLLLNDYWLEDNRIPPLGLTPDIETDPVGDRYTLLPGGTWPNFDRHSYDFPAAPEIYDVTPADPDDDFLEVTVRVRYIINNAEYMDFLEAEAGEAGMHVATLFDLAGGATPVTLGEGTVEIPIVNFGAENPGGNETTAGGESTSNTTTGGGPTSATDGPPNTTGPGQNDTTAASLPGGTMSVSSGTTGDTEPGAADDDGGGCDCRSGGGSGMPGAALLSMMLLGLRRRRRTGT